MTNGHSPLAHSLDDTLEEKPQDGVRSYQAIQTGFGQE